MTKQRVRMWEVAATATEAEEWARQHEGEVAEQMTVIWRDRPPEQYMVLLAAALRLVVLEKREAGNG